MAAGLLLMQVNGLLGPRDDFDHPDSLAARQAAEAGVAAAERAACPACGQVRPRPYVSSTSTPNFAHYTTSDVKVILDEAH